VLHVFWHEYTAELIFPRTKHEKKRGPPALPDLPSNNSPMTVPTIGKNFQEIRARLLARDNMIREISVWIKAWGLSSSQT